MSALPGQKIFTFGNGYGASVIPDPGFPGHELAVTVCGRITYDTPITGDVLRGLSDAEVVEVLAAISALPRRFGEARSLVSVNIYR